MTEIVYFKGWYSPELCEAHPDKLFLFGDNLRGFGMGGQAVIRRCPNAFGVPTKRAPSMAESAFFKEGSRIDLEDVLGRIGRLWEVFNGGEHTAFVVPVTQDGKVSLGLERAELLVRAPSIYETIVTHISEMAATTTTRTAEKDDQL